MATKKTEKTKSGFQEFPVLILENVAVLPGIPQPVKLEESGDIEFAKKIFEKKKEFFLTSCFINPDDGTPGDPERYGLICRIEKVIYMPDSPSMALIVPISRATCLEITEDRDNLFATIKVDKELTLPKQITPRMKMLREEIDKFFNRLLGFLNDPDRKNAQSMVDDFSKTPILRIYAMAQVAMIDNEEKYRLIGCNSYSSLLETCALIFDQGLQKMLLQATIHEKTHRELTRQQKESFLRTHLKFVKEELGETEEDEIDELEAKAMGKPWSEEAMNHFEKELGKLKRLNISNPEYSVQFNYLETLLELPWNSEMVSDISLKKVEKTLNRDHYGLEKVKDRIVEHMAVLKLRNDLKAPIICLYGPPGVGKTSIGKSVAEALGREYVRISLGGMHDEAEIRGHRRTYIGSMPGRFLQSLTKLQTNNPVMLLDEIDKVGKDYKGDPSSALLEALDPEQNHSFHDNFIDFPYDLSKVLFIATANDLSTIPAPLLDRMEVIEMSGYIPSEKREIAMRHLVDKALEENGFQKKEITFTREAIDFIIRYYTREAGVRELAKKIGKVLRKIAKAKVLKKPYPKRITPELAEEYLGKRIFNPDEYENNEYAGVATGLAWTPTGGDILFIETSLSPGKGEKLTLTGNLGDVMKESAMIALQYLKANAKKIGIEPEIFSKTDIHIHVPEGAVPKDGPSAGITLATSMASALTGRRLRERTAMTGEMTLRGKVLPVGGVKEKIIAARQAGIERIILSEENRKDIEEIAPQYLTGLEFIYVKTLQDVLQNILLDEKAKYHYDLN